MSPKALKASAKDETYFEEGVDAGSGPYTVADYAPGDEIVLEKYDEYWNDDAAGTYETIDISITPDAVTAQQMLTSGEVDYATSVPLENLEQLESTGDFEVRDSNSPFNFVALFNTTRPPLDDPKVRQALSYAMPYDDIIDVGAQGYGTQEPRPRAAGHLPVLRGRADVRAGPGQGRAAARRGRPRRRVQPDPDLRLGELGRGPVRPADQGRSRQDRRRGRRPRPALQPAVGEGQGRPRGRPGHLRGLLLADLQRRRCGQPLLAVPLQ